MNPPITISGTVIKTVAGPFDDGYTVMAVRISGEREEATAVAWLQSDVEGANFSARGDWVHHTKHGRQFKCAALNVEAPKTTDQIKARLVTYPGIGDAMADRIVARFKDDTWNVMDTAIGSLRQVRGIGASALRKITEHHAEQHGPVALIQNRLIELGAPPRLAMNIHKAFGENALEMLEQHPYQVAAKVERFGWGLAEKIGRAIGLDRESDERVDAGILHVMNQAQARKGHCAMPPKVLTDEAVDLLRIGREVVETGVARLVTAKDLTYYGAPGDDTGLIFLRRMDWTENSVAHSVARLATSEHPEWDVGELPDNLSAGQRLAVEAVCKSGLTIITGGPGTGKSTVLANVLTVADRANAPILCAPTGRAAKRMSEATGEPASTIHRLLGMNPGTGGWTYDKQNPLKAGLVVIDEASMVDVRLADALLSALTSGNRVLIVGDADQLPSVGAGNVLRDIIEAAEAEGQIIPVVRLTEVFRQAAGSTIIANAHRILAGEDLAPDDPSLGSDAEFLVLRASNTVKAHEKIVEMAATRIPAAFGFDRMTEVQVLCPMNSKTAGATRTDAFNEALQRIYTVDGEGFGPDKAPQRYYLGDRVMTTKNDYDRNVFNGDIGTVIRLCNVPGDGGVLTLDYDGTIAEYKRNELRDLRLAYAMTIHKAQGSEFPAVLVPMMMCHSVMLRRNLLYTAITRARRLCVIVGEPRAIKQAIDAADAAERWTGLASRLRGVLGRAG